ARGCCRRPPAGFACITQNARERGSEPEQVQDREAEDDGRNKDPRAITVVERHQLLRRRAHPPLAAVNDVRDDEEQHRDDSAAAPVLLPIRHRRPPFCWLARGGSRGRPRVDIAATNQMCWRLASTSPLKPTPRTS